MKKESKKITRRFKDGEVVFDPYIQKNIRYKHERDKYAQVRFKKIEK